MLQVRIFLTVEIQNSYTMLLTAGFVKSSSAPCSTGGIRPRPAIHPCRSAGNRPCQRAQGHVPPVAEVCSISLARPAPVASPVRPFPLPAQGVKRVWLPSPGRLYSFFYTAAHANAPEKMQEAGRVATYLFAFYALICSFIRGVPLPLHRRSGQCRPDASEYLNKDKERPQLVSSTSDRAGCPGKTHGMQQHGPDRDDPHTTPRERAAHREKMARLGRHAAELAHELKNPLQIILSQVGWMDELLGDEDPRLVKNIEEYRQALASIRSQVVRASRIVSQQLDHVRTGDCEREEVAVNTLVEETVSFLAGKVQQPHIELALQLDPALPVITGNRHQLQQVLYNLLDNALDAVGSRGTVLVRTHHTEEQVCIEVRDTGPGIPARLLKTIWTPFFTTKEPGKGTGLGLAISRDTILALGGALTAQNRHDGTGACFTITLPVHPRQPKSTKE